MHLATAPHRTTVRLRSCLTIDSFRRWFVLTALPAFLAMLSFGSIAAADDPDVNRVEEDWRIEIGTPNAAEHAPQILTVMSPLGHIEGPHVIFELNHSTFPEFTAGGMQLQKWFHETNFGYRNFPNYNRLDTIDETIEFTSRMEVTDDDLVVEIRDGTSQTWNSFGGQGYLKMRFNYLPIVNLNAYRPEVSTKNSRIGFASHRVRKLVLKEVRYYSSEGLLTRDETDRVVHEHQPE